jgi:penicillin amidase
VTRESPAAALYELWLGKLSTAVLHQIAPANTWAILEDLPVSKLVKCLSTPTTADFGPNPEARRNRIMFDALRSAASQLATLEGPDPVKWSWGQLHVVKFQHPLDQVPGAATLTDLGPASRPGDDETLDATGYEPGKFAQIEGASYREVLDTSDWDKSTAINVPGQSGQPVSPHQSDLLPLWLEGQYFPLAYSKAAVEKVTTDTLILQP